MSENAWLGFSRSVTSFSHPLHIPALIQHFRRVHVFHVKPDVEACG
jgi:hypothetical protein